MFFTLKKIICKHFTYKNILLGLVVVIVVSIAKHFLLGGLTAPFSFNNSIILRIIALITRLASTGLVEYLIDNLNLLDHTKMSVTGTPVTSYHMLPARGGEANISGNVASSSANNPGSNVATSSVNPTGAGNQLVD